jgi:hypothetical protein
MRLEINKRHRIGKEKVKLSLFAGNGSIYRKQRFHKTIRIEFNKVAGYKNVQKSVVFTYSNKNVLRKKSWEQSHSW